MSATVKRKVALVGFTISREDAPYDDPEWAVAGCNNLHAQPGMDGLWQKCDAWYDLHDLGTITGDDIADPGQKAAAVAHLQWLREGHKPCFVMPNARQPDWSAAIPFPRDEILAWADAIGLAGQRYFTNSVSWMIAHCIWEHVNAGTDQGRGGEIALFGIDMAQTTEYGSQRPSCEYWLGIAEGLGIKVTVSERADLLKCAFLYGNEDGSEFTKKMRSRVSEIDKRMEEANNYAQHLRNELEKTVGMQNQLVGAKENQNYINSVWLQPEGTRKGGEDPYASTATEQPHLQVVP